MVNDVFMDMGLPNGSVYKIDKAARFIEIKESTASKIYIDGVEIPKYREEKVRYGDEPDAIIRPKLPLWDIVVRDGKNYLVRSPFSNDGFWQEKSTVIVAE